MIDEKALDNYECEGQLSLKDIYHDQQARQESALIAVSRVFARAIKQMTLSEWKTFLLALTKIRWTEKNGNVISLDRKELANIIGIKPNPDHLNGDIFRLIKELPKHSYIEISREDKDRYSSGVMIDSIIVKKTVEIDFVQKYMPLFEELNKENDYITLWSSDLFGMKSERSILFYEDLRLHSDTRQTNEKVYTVQMFKEMFSIPKEGKGSYMQKNGFNRYMFEKKVILPMVEDLKKCRMINLIVNQDGSYWKKEKRNNRVVGYRFVWTVSTHPRVATGAEVRQLNQNPVALKIAKDITEGKKSSSAKKQTGSSTRKPGFNDFQKHDYSEVGGIEGLEKALLGN